MGRHPDHLRRRMVENLDGKTDAYTSFRTSAEAARFINDALASRRPELEQWLKQQIRGPRVFDVTSTADETGFGFSRRPDPYDERQIARQPLETFGGLRIILRKGGPKGWYLLSAFPIGPVRR
ncbi:MAG: hypothetical protein JO023_27640 [Chloroflexi bacterium]|nr:hypothetical protein [Chloroflexota bacterium]